MSERARLRALRVAPRSVRLAGLLAVTFGVMLGACPAEPVHVPGANKSVAIVVKLADLPATELDTVGSFALELFHNGAPEREIPLTFSSTSRTLAFLEEPTDLPTTGTLAIVVQARDLLGQPLAIGSGPSAVVSLDDIEDGSSATLFALVGRVGRSAPLGVSSDVGSNVHAAALGSGLLLVGDDGLQWLDLASGFACTSAAADGCELGAARPPSGAGLVVVALRDAFAATCPRRDSALLMLGSDLWLFDPARIASGGALEQLTVPIADHTAGVALPTADCRIVLAGGATTATDELVFVDGVDGDPGDVSVVAGPALTTAAAGAAQAATGNALGEVLVVGGSDGAAAGGASVVRTEGSLAACDLADDACNGEVAGVACPRFAPVAARVDDDSDLSPILVFGGDCATPELFRAAAEPPFGDFLAVAAPNIARRAGASLTAVPGGVLLAAGRELGAELTGDVSLFVLDNVSASAASGTWTSLTSLATPRADHAAVLLAGAVVFIGGEGAARSIEVVVPPRDASSPVAP